MARLPEDIGMPTLTIEITGPHAQRIATAFGAKHGSGRDATMAEFKADVTQYIKGVVRSYETEQAARAAADAVEDIDPS